MTTVEFSIKPVQRYLVWRAEASENGKAVGSMGEFDSEIQAHNAVLVFAEQETEMANPADRIVCVDGTYWDRKTGRWLDNSIS